jgi:hypothetical protein
MFVSRGLVGPKVHRNSSVPKGKQVNIPVLYDFKSQDPDALGYARRDCRPVQAYNSVEYRNGEKGKKA